MQKGKIALRRQRPFEGNDRSEGKDITKVMEKQFEGKG
jgi:hypothetical protein